MPALTWQEDRTTWRAMASPVTLTLPGADPGQALEIAADVEEDIEATEQALSRFRPDAELVRLNEHVGAWVEVSDRLYAALAAASRAYRQTGGLFDPRILDRLEQLGYAGAPRVRLARPAGTGCRWLQRNPRRHAVRALAPLDLGGIGKGLAVRWAARLARAAAPTFLLNAGGDLVAAGTGPEGEGWDIGIEDPRQPDALIAAVHLPAGGAVCTSSTARKHWEREGRPVHHLIDPRTGEPGGQGLLAVTVIGSDPAWSEVWSKALFLCSRAGIARAAGSRAVVWVTAGGEVTMTAAAEPLVSWCAPLGKEEPR